MMVNKRHINDDSHKWPAAEYPTTYSRAEIEAFTHRRDLPRSLPKNLPLPPTPTTHQLSAPTMRAMEDQLYMSQETGVEIS